MKEHSFLSIEMTFNCDTLRARLGLLCTWQLKLKEKLSICKIGISSFPEAIYEKRKDGNIVHRSIRCVTSSDAHKHYEIIDKQL